MLRFSTQSARGRRDVDRINLKSAHGSVALSGVSSLVNRRTRTARLSVLQNAITGTFYSTSDIESQADRPVANNQDSSHDFSPNDDDSIEKMFEALMRDYFSDSAENSSIDSAVIENEYLEIEKLKANTSGPHISYSDSDVGSDESFLGYASALSDDE